LIRCAVVAGAGAPVLIALERTRVDLLDGGDLVVESLDGLVGPCVEDVDVDESSDGVDADDDSAGHEVERVDGEREREVRLQAHGGLEYGGSRWGGRPDGQPGDGQRGAHQEVG